MSTRAPVVDVSCKYALSQQVLHCRRWLRCFSLQRGGRCASSPPGCGLYLAAGEYAFQVTAIPAKPKEEDAEASPQSKRRRLRKSGPGLDVSAPTKEAQPEVDDLMPSVTMHMPIIMDETREQIGDQVFRAEHIRQ
jgi:hypothetical protein